MLLLLLTICASTWVVMQIGFFQILESKTRDLRFRGLGGSQKPSDEIVLVSIDDNSLKSLEDYGRWPWPRDVHAVLIDYLKSGGARVIAFDILFPEADSACPQCDLTLGTATARAGNVVHSVFLGLEKIPSRAPLSESTVAAHSVADPLRGDEYIDLDLPIPPVADSARALGHVSMTLDPDGPWRTYHLLGSLEGRLFPSLALSVVLVSQGLRTRDLRVDGRVVAAGTVRAGVAENRRIPIWYNGGPETYRSYSFGQLFYSALQIQEGEEPEIDPAVFENKIVLVGLAATGLHEIFTTSYSGAFGEPSSNAGKMFGHEIHANMVDNLLHNRYLRSGGPVIDALVVGSIALSTLLLILYAPILPGLLSVVAVLIVYLLPAQWAFSAHYQLPVVAAVFAWISSVSVGLAFQYRSEGAEKRRVKRIFSRYVSRDVYKELLENPKATHLGGQRATITVLFSDLREFTALSEEHAPEDVVSQLNEYFSAMVEIVFDHKGTVDKFVGDMMMALFNAPLPDPSHADHAVQCGVAMHRRLEELNRVWRQVGKPELRCGVGINTGDMIVGNLGAEAIRNYTVIGDNVNLGARLESLCKDHEAEVIISDHTRRALREAYPLTNLGEVTVKGRSERVRIYRVDRDT